MWTVIISKSAQKELNKAPIRVQEEFLAWMNLIISSGPKVLLTINGYWDHSLKGDWQGARASSLNRKWRVVYYIDEKTIKIMVLQISAHKY